MSRSGELFARSYCGGINNVSEYISCAFLVWRYSVELPVFLYRDKKVGVVSLMASQPLPEIIVEPSWVEVVCDLCWVCASL